MEEVGREGREKGDKGVRGAKVADEAEKGEIWTRERARQSRQAGVRAGERSGDDTHWHPIEGSHRGRACAGSRSVEGGRRDGSRQEGPSSTGRRRMELAWVGTSTRAMMGGKKAFQESRDW